VTLDPDEIIRRRNRGPDVISRLVRRIDRLCDGLGDFDCAFVDRAFHQFEYDAFEGVGAGRGNGDRQYFGKKFPSLGTMPLVLWHWATGTFVE
jgi:hypothetical protein